MGCVFVCFFSFFFFFRFFFFSFFAFFFSFFFSIFSHIIFKSDRETLDLFIVNVGSGKNLNKFHEFLHLYRL